ncbi:OppA family ABC transporter substrate-binding lipoprotein [Mycoplasma sp. ATU-Cv-508]|uniref:OppA family ABC transporter substrate-binding lipoprotein n=1 Tax=Mycoplasma sp. ATU-Cv-508 TaxID=2048001 RepID=UPI000FDD39BB
MTYKGWLRLGAGFFATTALLGAAGLGIAYGLPDQSVVKNNLRTVINSVNANSWYRFDKSFSYGSISSNDLHSPLVAGQLVRSSSRGENARVVDLSQPVDEDFNLNLKPSEHRFSQFLKLELASKVVVRQTNTNLVFDSDVDDAQLKNSINSDFFRQALESPNTLALDFVVRTNVPWVNHLGQAATSPTGEIYYLQALDWLYGVYRTGLTNNNWRHAPVDISNPFGGYGVLPPGQDQQKWSQRWSEQSRQASVIGRFRPLASVTGGFSNNYLYDIFGVKNLIELVTPLPGRRNAALIGDFEGQPTVSIQAKNSTVKPNFGQFFKKFLDAQEFIPAPSGYIQDYASKVNYVSGNGASLVVPDKQDPAIVSSEINVRKYGVFTYGTDWNNTLYIGPYYVKKNNQFQVEYDLNPHYWDKRFVKSDQTVKNIIFDYSPQSDNKIFAQSMFEQYRHGRVFSLELNDLASNKIFDIKKEPEKFGLRYVDSQIDNRFVGDMFPIALPFPELSNYHFNDNFAQLWFGTSLSNIDQGKMQLGDYLKPTAVAFRSQIMAAINWYTQNRTMSKLDQTEPWYPPLPPDAPINAQNSDSEKPRTFYDYRGELNRLTYYELGSDNFSLEKNTVSMEQNKQVYQQTSSLQESLKSAVFEKIQPAIQRTIQAVLDRINQSQLSELLPTAFPK